MALVSYKHGVVYLKTIKTGGTSVEMALQPLCSPPGTEVTHFCDTMISEYGIVGARGGEGSGAEDHGFRNHMAAAKLAEKIGADRWAQSLKIASARNPFDKAVSWFWYRARKEELKIVDPVEDFRAFFRRYDAKGHFQSGNDVDWRVTHIDGVPVIDMYLRLEKLETDFAALFARLGIPGTTLSLPKVKAETRARDVLRVSEYFDAPTADLVKRHFDWMFEAGSYSLDPLDADRASDGTARDIVVPSENAPAGREGDGA